MSTTIIIADDHPLILKGLNDFLLEKNYNVLDSAENGKDAFRLIEQLQPEIAILDIKMPYLTGLEIAKKCNELNYTTKIILITFEKDETLYYEAKTLNIYGYVLKEFALVEIENCIASVLNNKPYFSPELIAYLAPTQSPEEIQSLTPTELDILKLIAQNNTAKDIGGLLDISYRTVEKHKSNIIRKLDIEAHQNSLLIWAKENQNFLG